jgi:hypothetical protein
MKSRSRHKGGIAKKDQGQPAGSRIIDLRTGYSRNDVLSAPESSKGKHPQ